MSNVVAVIDKDHIPYDDGTGVEGKEFHFEEMDSWWGWEGGVEVTLDEMLKSPKIRFRLYDDDDILYYEGWLLNDDYALVQQFVLDWAKYDSGCTYIEVRVNGAWKMEIA